MLFIFLVSSTTILNAQTVDGNQAVNNNISDTNQSTNSDSTVVDVPDLTLKHEINAVLGQDENSDITYDQMKTITKLDLDGDITDLKGIETAVNLEEIDLFQDSGNSLVVKNINVLTQLKHLTTLDFTQVNLTATDITNIAQISSLTSLSLYGIDTVSSAMDQIGQMTNLKVLSLQNENLHNSDLKNLTKLTNLDFLNLDGNKLTDLSPLSTLPCSTSVARQYVSDLTFDIYGPILPTKMSIYDRDGAEHVIDLTKVGDNEVFGTFTINDGEDNLLSGYIDAKCIPQKLTGETEQHTNETINEETILSDDDLIALFDVHNPDDIPISVDHSDVDFTTPGTYPVVFGVTDDYGNTSNLTSNLEILDILPKITTEKTSLTINLNDPKPDFIADYGVNATEIENNDLLKVVNVDDSAVDYTKVGSYDVIFSVEDDEGNTDSKTVKLIIKLDRSFYS